MGKVVLTSPDEDHQVFDASRLLDEPPSGSTTGKQAEARSGEGVEPSRALDSIAQARDIDELERIRRAAIAVGEAAYHWSIKSDKIAWSSGADVVLGGADPDAMATGRGYASLFDQDCFTNRFETVMHSPENDTGDGVPFAIEYLFKPRGRSDEAAVWLEDCGRWYAGKDGRPAEVFGMIRQIDDRREREQHLQYLGNCDPLTGMMNRGRMAEALAETMDLAKKENDSCAFVIIAINNLPLINDAYGFDVADEVIVAVGERLRNVVRGGDAIGRYSGSKFGLILSDCSDDDLQVASERFLDVAREGVIDTEMGPVWATLAIGALLLPKFARDANQAMARAEEALADAKRLPSDGLVAYKPSEEVVSVRSLNARCAGEIVKGLREERFSLAYQPIVDSSNSDIVMYEALLRMRRDDGEIVPAGHLVPIAEKLGLVRMIDRTVMELAINAANANPDVRISLNVSGVTATDPKWFNQLTDLIKQNLDAAPRLMIEITETVALHDLDQTIRFINSLRELGCQIAIDDFGAGYTSFRNLKVLDIDMVKIDGSFCEDLTNNRDNQYFVKSLIDLAKKFDLKIIGEWVQNETDADLLRSWGVEYLQGNHYGEARLDMPAKLQPPFHGVNVGECNGVEPQDQETGLSQSAQPALSADEAVFDATQFMVKGEDSNEQSAMNEQIAVKPVPLHEEMESLTAAAEQENLPAPAMPETLLTGDECDDKAKSDTLTNDLVISPPKSLAETLALVEGRIPASMSERSGAQNSSPEESDRREEAAQVTMGIDLPGLQAALAKLDSGFGAAEPTNG